MAIHREFFARFLFDQQWQRGEIIFYRISQNRSELVRTALEKFLRDQKQKQFMDTLVSEAKAAYADESVRREAREIAEDFLPLDNEALDLAEGRKPSDPESKQWWK